MFQTLAKIVWKIVLYNGILSGRLFQSLVKIVPDDGEDCPEEYSRHWQRLFQTLVKIVPDTGRLSGRLFQTLAKIVPDAGEDSLWTFNKPQPLPNKFSPTL